MKAQVLTEYGQDAAFEYAELPDPVRRPGEVLVRVRAAALNPADTKTMRAKPPFAPAAPAILGTDFAGDIVEVSAEDSGYKVGDRVFGFSGGVRGFDGVFAELKRVDPRQMAPIPQGMSYREAAALPMAGVTAYDALVTRAGLQADETVLITGPAGGVGHVGVQIARARGARVLATASTPEKAGIAAKLGANRVILHNAEDVERCVMEETDGLGVNVIFDTSGVDKFELWMRCIAQQGRIILLATRFSADLTGVMFKGLTISVPFVYSPMLPGGSLSTHKRVLKAIHRLVERGELRPLVDRAQFDLERLPEAIAHMQSGTAIGKVVVDV